MPSLKKDYSGGYVGMDFDSVSEVMQEQGYDSTNYSTVELCDHLDVFLNFFGKEDRDIVYMFFVLKKKQNDIADILNKTQPQISYDTNRIKNQVDYVVFLISVVDRFLMYIEESNELNEEDRNILLTMFFSSSYTQSSKILDINKITLRNKFLKILDRIKNEDEEIWKILDRVSKNLNKIKKHVID